MARHSEIYPKEEELQAIQTIVSRTERALKIVSDQLFESSKPKDGSNGNTAAPAAATPAQQQKPAEPVKQEGETKTQQPVEQKEDGRDNQL